MLDCWPFEQSVVLVQSFYFSVYCWELRQCLVSIQEMLVLALKALLKKPHIQ